MKNKPYLKLEEIFHRLGILRDIKGILHWDNATVMPLGGSSGRSDQLAEINALSHAILTDNNTADLLEEAENDKSLDFWQMANLRLMRHKLKHARALSKQQVLSLSKAASACETVWRQARVENNFAIVLPYLENVVSLIRECAEAKSEKLGLSPYDTLLDEFEPGGRSAEIDVQFGELESFLPNFLNEVLEKQNTNPPPSLPKGPFEISAQHDLCLKLMSAVGFDFKHGRLDTSMHPFCGGTPDDIRITTRFDENNFTSGIMAVLHETGHSLYERQLPEKWRYQPVGEALGMAVHESQSLLIEMQLSRSLPFIEFAAPLIRDAFKGSGETWEARALYHNLIHVEPGFIRVDADEVTYPLHVILRYQLEKDIITGDLALKDLPAAWNVSMEKLLGIYPANDSEGCLQDIHWYDGTWGYFPTYTLGAIISAQLFVAAEHAIPNLKGKIAKGNFSPLIHWLDKNVHSLGCSIETEELVKLATGHTPNNQAFINHLKNRYLS